jgi:hypothetical protein
VGIHISPRQISGWGGKPPLFTGACKKLNHHHSFIKDLSPRLLLLAKGRGKNVREGLLAASKSAIGGLVFKNKIKAGSEVSDGI